MQQNITIRTRPFQPFFLAADDLLKLAKPYFNQIQESKGVFDKTGKFADLPDGVWQTEKSLSIGAFMIKYSALEAFINCIIYDFSKIPTQELADHYFVGPLQSLRKKLKEKKPQNWHLATRVFLCIPLCSDPEIDPRSVFDIDSSQWKKFEEVVDIRHSYAHAKGVNVKQLLTKVSPKQWNANDQHPDNFWPLTKSPRDHRILNYEAASELCDIIGWVVHKLRCALPTHLSDSYGSQEQAKIENGGSMSLGIPNKLSKFRQKTTKRPIPKQGRNELCACGSGKKFKRCCGR